LKDVFRFLVGFFITAQQINRFPGTVTRVNTPATVAVVTEVAKGGQ